VRVTRAFAFMDISGFTTLTDLEGDERAVRLLTAMRAQLREMCSRRGVRIAKWLGDGAMLVCVETRPIVAATLEAQHRMAARTGPDGPINIRTGLSAGPVILLEGDDYIGHAVNVAARLCDLARAGEVLATAAVVDALPRWATVLRTEDMPLRGIERPVPVSRVSYRPSGPDGQADPVCGLVLPPGTAEATATDGLGRAVPFCSDSCFDTWRNRPAPPSDELGSPRQPLIGT
jgi:class 3 adenylate cyclase